MPLPAGRRRWHGALSPPHCALFFLPFSLSLSLGVATMRHVRLGKSCGEGSLHWSGGIEIDRAVTIRARESGDKKQPARTCRCRCHPAPVLLTKISGCLLTLCLPPPFVLSLSHTFTRSMVASGGGGACVAWSRRGLGMAVGRMLITPASLHVCTE
jgi:hypothetical protein